MDTKKLQQEFINWCKAKKKSPKTKEETQQLFHTFMKEKYPKEYEAAMKGQEQQQTQKALHGAKLNYIRSLKNQCAPDEQVVYYKKGSIVDCGCKKKEEGEVTQTKCGAVAKFKAKKMKYGGQPKVVNGSTKQLTIDGTKKAYEEFKRKQAKKKRQQEIDKLSEQDYYEGKQDHGDNPPNSPALAKSKKVKCGAKMKKHQQGGSLNGIPFIQKKS